MIILEFLIFVVSSGLFCSERFRGHIWAVIVAGAIATGSSLLFMYDLGAKVTGHTKEPPVITRIVQVPVIKTVQPSQPASAGKSHSCAAAYPAESLSKGEEGVTKLSFKILTDGTVDGVKVLASSGSQKLDEAAVKCAGEWHYRPAIKDGKLADVDSSAVVKWVLPKATEIKPEPPANADEEQKKPEEPTPAAETHSESRHWYDPWGWFSGEPDKKQQQQP
jgi:TonB family protein